MSNKVTYLSFQRGVIENVTSRVLWGLASLYIGLIPFKNTYFVFSNRVVWAFVFSMCLVLFSKKLPQFFMLISNFKIFMINLLATIIISANWLMVIYCTNHNELLNASLGYFISPLFTVLMGIIFFKEKINLWIVLSLLACLLGIFIIFDPSLSFPWQVFQIALSSALYPVIRKKYPLHPFVSNAFETGICSIIVITYLCVFGVYTTNKIALTFTIILKLIGLGVVTTLPMLFYTSSLKNIPIALAGYLQYITPTIMTITSILIFNESLNIHTGIGFVFIWLALGLYFYDQHRSNV